MKQYFTELEAAEAAGVSLETIKEFVTLGVLKLHPADNNSTSSYLTKSDLVTTFHNLKDLGVTVEIQKEVPQVEPTPVAEPAREAAASREPEVREAPASPPPIIEPTPASSFIEHRSFELLDLNKSLKDQIEILKQERDWLRKRVETLEIRSERDQLLLMSETKTVQALLPHASQKKSFWSNLPWFNKN